MNPFGRLFRLRWRGFRIVELAALACLVTLVLGVYAFKALAGRESAEIGDVDAQIVEEQHRVRLLHAELAHLEQPERIERLSGQYLGLAPISAKREAPAEALTEIARAPAPAPSPAPAVAPPAPAAPVASLPSAEAHR